MIVSMSDFPDSGTTRLVAAGDDDYSYTVDVTVTDDACNTGSDFRDVSSS